MWLIKTLISDQSRFVKVHLLAGCTSFLYSVKEWIKDYSSERMAEFLATYVKKCIGS